MIIQMETPPNKTLIGKTVVYRPWNGCPMDQLESGILTSFKEHQDGKYTIFVRYGKNSHSKATRPEDLTVMGNDWIAGFLGEFQKDIWAQELCDQDREQELQEEL